MGTKKKVAIIGGGLAGLSAAIYLSRKAVDFDLFEASDKLGGRISTEQFGGFMLDKGFQVFLNSYEEAKSIIDFDKLGLKKAASGAMIKDGGSWKKFGNPLKNISDSFPTLFSGIGGFNDKFLIFKLSIGVGRLSQDEIQQKENLSTLAFLQQYGFSEGMIKHFFKPFFGGVFLDFELETSSRLFLYLFKKFAEGEATLPAKGMVGIIDAMMEQLPEQSIHLKNKIDLDNLEGYDSTIIAVNASSKVENASRQFNGTLCYYFSCNSVSFSNTSYLHLNPENGIIRHVCFLNRVQPTYAPKGKDLLSVTVNFDSKINRNQVQNELSTLFDNQLENLEFLKSYSIPEALSFFNGEMKGVYRNMKGQIVCGDHTLYPSINAAIKSGRLAAEMVIADLA